MFFPVLGRILTVILGKRLVKQGWVAVSAVLCNFLDRALSEHQKTGSFLQSSDRQIGMGGNADFRFQPSVDVGSQSQAVMFRFQVSQFFSFPCLFPFSL